MVGDTEVRRLKTCATGCACAAGGAGEGVAEEIALDLRRDLDVFARARACHLRRHQVGEQLQTPEVPLLEAAYRILVIQV